MWVVEHRMELVLHFMLENDGCVSTAKLIEKQ